ncbi:FecR family protein [Pedobacter sp. Leaf250]|uniref:FecR family protein n=1 Tax=Pedobacter sp. Leaf250 TaxID=2876559 RepID=UPI001E635D85|nr:FecR family protein [Pedobacter sp. Leaf250]
MNKDLYRFYSVEDFLADSDFIRFVNLQTPEDVSFWKAWASEYPERQAFFQEAYAQLNLILINPEFIVPGGFKDNLLSDINDSIDKFESKRKRKKMYTFWSSSIAASLILAIISFWYFTSNITINTDFGETKSISLSDGSVILLNANSTLTYPRAYSFLKVRSIALKGEAYFKVKHINKNPSIINAGEIFIAKTDGVEVEVLGTEFNLKERRGLANITLINGRVKVRSVKTAANYFMKPGNTIKINTMNGQLIPDLQPGIIQSSWIEGKLDLKQATVNEIISAFQDLYGYRVILEDPTLGFKKIDGSISINSEQSLLFTLSNILNVNIKKEGKIIRLESRH